MMKIHSFVECRISYAIPTSLILPMGSVLNRISVQFESHILTIEEKMRRKAHKSYKYAAVGSLEILG